MVDFNILKLEVCVKSHDEEEPEIDGIEVDRQQCSRAGQLACRESRGRKLRILQRLISKKIKAAGRRTRKKVC